MHSYEVEIKSLLGSRENAQALKETLAARGDLQPKGKHSQLNHYFNLPENLKQLEAAVVPLVAKENQERLKKILEEGENHSIRTREADGSVFFIVKASVGDDTSANGVSRMEFEEPIDLTLDALDQLLLDAGLTYQAKWSRDREEYVLGDMNITIDKNAGYGYLAEFEKVVHDGETVKDVEAELRGFIKACGVEELAQDRLERMFAHYNEHWADYYGTDNTFVIE